MFDVAQHPAEPIVLRDYQETSIQALRDSVRRGQKRVILCAATGAGKTVLASHLLREADAKGSYSLFLVDRVTLVDQTSATLDRYGIGHGVIQGNHPRWDPWRNVQVGSVQTLARRSLPRSPSLIVVDEAHVMFKSTVAFMDEHPAAVRVGLTATPFAKGMGKLWGGMVNVLPTSTLVREGHLIEPVIYEARAPDRDRLSINGKGEFDDRSSERAGIEIVGDIVAEWEAKTAKHFGGPVKTIVFAATVEHGREICAAFAEAGHRFEQISYMDRDEDERRAKIRAFKGDDGLEVRPGEIVGLVSCGVLTRGFDVPSVRCGISAKPYRKSLSSHMQEMGRVMRTCPGKAESGGAIWLCHSGNVSRLQADAFDVWDNGPGELAQAAKQDAKAREASEAERKESKCPNCGAMLHGADCNGCGWHRPARSGIVALEGELHQVERSGPKPRDGLRAACLEEPREVWASALGYCLGTMRDEVKARKRAYAMWCSIYPGSKPGFGWFDMPRPALTKPDADALIEREVRRFRKAKAASR